MSECVYLSRWRWQRLRALRQTGRRASRRSVREKRRTTEYGRERTAGVEAGIRFQAHLMQTSGITKRITHTVTQAAPGRDTDRQLTSDDSSSCHSPVSRPVRSFVSVYCQVSCLRPIHMQIFSFFHLLLRPYAHSPSEAPFSLVSRSSLHNGQSVRRRRRSFFLPN